jgi:hypothetical protein
MGQYDLAPRVIAGAFLYLLKKFRTNRVLIPNLLGSKLFEVLSPGEDLGEAR